MARTTINVDTTEVCEVLDEIGTLCRQVANLPNHIERRVDRIMSARERGAIEENCEVRFQNGGFVASPGPELLCLLVDLRILAGKR